MKSENKAHMSKSLHITALFYGNFMHAYDVQSANRQKSCLQDVFEGASPHMFWSIPFSAITQEKQCGEPFCPAGECQETLSGIADSFLTDSVKPLLIKANRKAIQDRFPHEPDYVACCEDISRLANRLVICAQGSKKKAFDLLIAVLKESGNTKLPNPRPGHPVNVFTLFVDTLLCSDLLSLSCESYQKH